MGTQAWVGGVVPHPRNPRGGQGPTEILWLRDEICLEPASVWSSSSPRVADVVSALGIWDNYVLRFVGFLW